MGQYRINLLNYGTSDSGEVMISEEEIIGMWQVDENGFFTFFAAESEEPLFLEPFLPTFCDRVWQWHLDQSHAP